MSLLNKMGVVPHKKKISADFTDGNEFYS